MTPDIQYFAESGTWTKPPTATAVDVVLCAGGAGAVLGNGNGKYTVGEDGELTVQRVQAAVLADKVEVTIGRGGRPGGRDGYALIITHLEGTP